MSKPDEFLSEIEKKCEAQGIIPFSVQESRRRQEIIGAVPLLVKILREIRKFAGTGDITGQEIDEVVEAVLAEGERP